MTAPASTPQSLGPAVADRLWQMLRRRVLSPGGVGVQHAVTTAASSSAVTLARREPDGRYAVFATTSWPTTLGISGRTATGFTATYGTAAPAGATLDYFIARSE